MSKATFELGELICQHLTLRYSPHGKRALAKLAKEMGSTVEQIVATSLARRIEKRFDLTPKAEGSPPWKVTPWSNDSSGSLSPWKRWEDA